MGILNKKGISIIEYLILLIIIIGAVVMMRDYIQRGVHHGWVKTGQSFAFGRQYDPQKTIECAFDVQFNRWYDRNCYKHYFQKCDGDAVCEEKIISTKCQASSCGQL